MWFTTYSYIGQLDPLTGVITLFPITPYGYAYDITAGPDGNVWFTEDTGRVGFVTPGGAVTEYSLGPGVVPAYITGLGGSAWFTASVPGGNAVYQITGSGTVTQYLLPSGWIVGDITAAADGLLWFDSGTTAITAMTTAGSYVTYSWPLTSPDGYSPQDLRPEPDGALAFADADGGAIGQLTTGGRVSFASIPSGNGSAGLAVGADGTIWFTEPAGNAVGMVPPGAAAFSASVPAAQTDGCGCGGPAFTAPAQAFQGDAVNTATGAFSPAFPQVQLPGPGAAFGFSLAYTSGDAAAGPLGPGWTGSYLASLSFDAGGDATFTSGTGQQLAFTSSGGSYTPAAGVTATLAAVPGGYQLTALDGTRLDFNSAGQLTAETDLAGNGVTLAYAGGQLASATSTGGRTVSFGYDAAGQLSSLTMPDGSQISYGYDSAGRLATVTDPGGGVTGYGYDAAGQLATITDPDGHVVLTNSYDSATGRITAQQDGDGNVTTFSWDAGGQVATTTEPDGERWTDGYDGNVLAWQMDPAGGVSYYGYNASLDLTSYTDPDGNQTQMSYDGAGNMLSMTAPAPLYDTWQWTYNSRNEVTTATSPGGQVTSYGYTAAGLLASITDPDGHLTSISYNSGVQPATVTDPDDRVTSYSYDSSDDLAAVTSPGGQVTSYTYNSLGEQTGSTSPAGNTTSYRYDADGNLTAVTSPLGDTTSYGYDADGNLTSLTTPAGDTTAYGYDNDGNLTSVTGPDGEVTSYTWTGDGQLATETDPDGDTASYAYDNDGDVTMIIASDGGSNVGQYYYYDYDGNLIQYQDQLGNATSYAYNPVGQVTSVISPDGDATSYGYDADGNLTAVTSPSGQVTSYGYDPDGQLTAVGYTDGATPDVSYGYDPAGQLTSMTDGTGTTSYTWTSDGQPATVTGGAGNTVSYGYNSDGDPVTITYPNGQAVTDSYNAGQELSAVSDWNGNTTSFSYDADGDLTAEAYPNGDTAAYAYNHDDQLTAITDTSPAGTTLAAYSYGRDADGNITSATTAGTALSPGTATYTYTPLSQLTGDGTTSYGYDSAGDPVTLGTTTQIFPHASQLQAAEISAATTYHYTYNTSGDRITFSTGTATTSYGYNQASQLTSYTPPAGPATSYAYTGDGLLASQTTSGTTTSYTWDTATAVPQLLSDGTSSYLYGPGGQPVEQISPAGTPTYLMQDQLGSTRLLTSSTGVVTGTYSYDPWGDTTSHTGTATSQLLYAGAYQDPATGLYYLINRWYDPATAQYLTPDPLVNQTHTPYTYADDNPVNTTDPTGLDPEELETDAAGIGESLGGPTLEQSVASGAHGFLNDIESFFDGAASGAQDALNDTTSQSQASATGQVNNAEADRFGGPAAEDTGDLADAATCGGASFTPGTRVLLASGAAIPISQLKPGDMVLATNVKTGRTQAEPVTAVLLHHDTDRYDLTVKTAHGSAVIDTTSSHLFWDVTQHRWVKASALGQGSYVRTPAGASVTVLGGHVPADASGWMWDLSVPGGGDHDFYIDVIRTAVLVHNCDVPGLDASGKIHTYGDLPSYIPDNWTAEQIQQLESDLQQSIATRQHAMQDLGEEPAHMQRIQQEFQLLRQVQKWLSGS